MMRMADRNRQRVGRVLGLRRRLRQQHAHHHPESAPSRHGPRRRSSSSPDSAHIPPIDQTGLRGNEQRHPARLTKFQSGGGVLAHKGRLDGGFGRPIILHDAEKPRMDGDEPVADGGLTIGCGTEPQATKASLLPSMSMTPQPVRRRPGSMPRMRIGGVISSGLTRAPAPCQPLPRLGHSQPTRRNHRNSDTHVVAMRPTTRK